MTPVSNPFPLFTDTLSQIAEGARIYIGLPEQDPEVAPAPVFWDAALTIPAQQPLRTIAGYIVNNGTPAAPYVDGPYSIRVRQASGAIVYYRGRVVDGISEVAARLTEAVAGFAADTGATKVGNGASSIAEQTRRNIRMYPGSVTDGTTSNVAAINALLANGGGYLPRQAQPYVVDQQITMPVGSFLTFEDGAKVKWTGPATNGAFAPVFAAQSGCTIGAESGEMEIYTDTPDRYRYAVFCTAISDVTLRGVLTRHMQRIYCNSSAGTYAGTITSGSGENICRNIRVYGGGSTYDVPLSGGQSTAADYFGYTIDWRVEDARHTNGTSGIQWWGGDANPTVDGARANERKCGQGVILRCAVDNVLGAGIWGSMASDVQVFQSKVSRCHDVGFDAEGSWGVTWDGCEGSDCSNGVFAEFFHTEGITAVRCKAVGVNGQPVYLFQNGTGYSNGTKISACDFANSGTGTAAISSQFGNVRNLKVSDTRGADVTVDLTYNTNQNVAIAIELRFTKPIMQTAFRAGRTNKLGDRGGSLIVDGTVITTDVAQNVAAMQIDQYDAATPPPTTQAKGISISEGWTFGLITAGTSGQYTILNGTIGSGTIQKIGSGQTHTIANVYNWAGAQVS